MDRSRIRTLPSVFTGISDSTRKPTANSKPDSKSQERDEPRTKSATEQTALLPTSTDPETTTPRQQKIDTSQSCIAGTRPVKRRASANTKKNDPPRPPIETVNDTRASRPRRAAAVKAMKNLSRTT